jgi:ATP-dependent DNA helicase RecG
LIPKKVALFNIHFPTSAEVLAKAKFRLIFEEFLIQLQLITKNRIRKHKIKGYPFATVGENFNDLSASFAFQLTNAQKMIKEIRTDM